MFVCDKVAGMLQGSYGGTERDKPLVRLPFTVFTLWAVCLPLLGFITCVIISLIYHYNEATYTHCQVCITHTHVFHVLIIYYIFNTELYYQSSIQGWVT